MGHRAFIVGLAFLVSVACDARMPAATHQERGQIVWRTIGSWSGRGNTQTGSFTVDTGALRLTWSTKNETAPGAGRFRVALHSAISGRPLQTIVDRAGVAVDIAYFEDDPRVSYLVIESANVDWTATLEEGVTVDGGGSP